MGTIFRFYRSCVLFFLFFFAKGQIDLIEMNMKIWTNSVEHVRGNLQLNCEQIATVYNFREK